MIAERAYYLKLSHHCFTLFIKGYWGKELLDCFERNEKMGVVYHREDIFGDYDDFDDAEELICFIKTEKI